MIYLEDFPREPDETDDYPRIKRAAIAARTDPDHTVMLPAEQLVTMTSWNPNDLGAVKLVGPHD